MLFHGHSVQSWWIVYSMSLEGGCMIRCVTAPLILRQPAQV